MIYLINYVTCLNNTGEPFYNSLHKLTMMAKKYPKNTHGLKWKSSWVCYVLGKENIHIQKHVSLSNRNVG